uniref:(northern house mosquito) hypothetical protein n=1 Tax=Culex pipiens TaxID=7175 RepID=A0A8D8P2B9_CULPI
MTYKSPLAVTKNRTIRTNSEIKSNKDSYYVNMMKFLASDIKLLYNANIGFGYEKCFTKTFYFANRLQKTIIKLNNLVTKKNYRRHRREQSKFSNEKSLVKPVEKSVVVILQVQLLETGINRRN